ncbi:hypothetical protein FAZ95_23030 [Trinickia violacea]|uniref:Protein kinase domain-containing protein n=1 Tax=Trinickia violacea TaxID=2571746 RepID=A0A4P8IUM5_9BURK|nr:hypothetical protein [Trinickia violacea]QCP52071.1 hypothetical protein FAZ95_23030 [Trinickia violacea]
MPLNKLSTGVFPSKEVLALNKAIDQYNANPNALQLDTIEAIINSRDRANWTSKAMEIMRLEMAINAERRAFRGAAQGVSGVGILGPSAVVNLAPTAWIEILNANAPSLDGVLFDGTGKQGAQGNTHKMSLPNGKKLFAKTARGHDKGSVETECQREYRVYKRLYETAGEHPNLVKVWGWADIRFGVQHEIGFIMDHIDGPDGRAMQSRLKEAWDLGIVSSAEYWSSIQYIGRCHVKVIQYLKGAGWVHNDIKPENYVVDSASGEVIVIDLGGAGLSGERWNAVTVEYLAPEMMNGGRPDLAARGAVASDIFSLGASIAHAAEAAHAFHAVAQPNQGLTANATAFRQIGRPVEGIAPGRYKNPFEYGVETDYTRQLMRMMNENPLEREKTLDEHSSNKFLNDSILDDEQAREVLKGIASGARKKSWEEKWLRAGKSPPTGVMMDRSSLESKLNDKMRHFRGSLGISVNSNLSKAEALREEADLNRKRKELEEVAKLINQANAFGIDTSRDRRIVGQLLRECDGAEQTIKAALGRHQPQGSRQWFRR